MLPILWLPSARDDLRQIVAYIAKENIPAARRLKIRIENIRQCPGHPQTQDDASCHLVIFDRPGCTKPIPTTVRHPFFRQGYSTSLFRQIG